MIYYITKNNKHPSDTNIKTTTVEKSLNYLNKLDWVSFDIETTGLDRHTAKIILIQLGNYENQFVIDFTTIGIDPYISILTKKNLIIQNAKFELQFMYVLNIIPKRLIWDTMLAEKVITNKYYSKKDKSKVQKTNMGVLADKYCNVTLNKSHRKALFYNNQININDILYAADDIKYLNNIKRQQYNKAIELEVLKAIHLENKVVKVFAYIEYCGIKLNPKKWRDRIKILQPILQKQYNKTMDLIMQIKYAKKVIGIQTDLFSDNNKYTLNLNSDIQMKPIFKSLGISLYDRKAKSKESINAKILAKYEKKHPVIKEYLKYQKLDKENTTYGIAFLNNINSKTGRIHTEYNQLISTGRISSKNPNMNNIPKDEITRACFIPEKNNILIDIDYTDQEGRIFANYSKDKNLIEFYHSDFSDGHSYVAKLCFKEELKDVPMEKVEELRPDLRFKAKSARFAINYAGTGMTISENINVSEKEGEEIYNAYLTAFPDSAKYFDYIRNATKKRKYIILSPITNRKFFWNEDLYDIHDKEFKDFVKKSLNYPIQGSAADMIKIAMIYIFDWILQNKLFNIVKIIGSIYDELLIEAPIELKEEVADKVKYFMEKSADLFCKIVKIPAKPLIAYHWVH